MDYLIYIFVVIFFAYFIYSVFSKKGKGKMFGGEIIETLSPTIEQQKGITTIKIKVHTIKPNERPHERDVGIEMTQNAKLGWSMTPIALTSSEAKELGNLINQALEKNA